MLSHDYYAIAQVRNGPIALLHLQAPMFSKAKLRLASRLGYRKTVSRPPKIYALPSRSMHVFYRAFAQGVPFLNVYAS